MNISFLVVRITLLAQRQQHKNQNNLLKVRRQQHCVSVFIVSFERILQIVLVFLLLTLKK